MALAVAAFLLLGASAPAWASTGLDGPTPPQLGDPSGSGVSPHGGYSTTGGFCRQCHSVHQANGGYALLSAASLTATCATCHGTMGTLADRTAYDLSSPASGHTIGASAPPGEQGIVMTQTDWQFSWGSHAPAADAATPADAGRASETGGGLYCGSCHAAHGDYGQLVNSWTGADEGDAIWWKNPTTHSWSQERLHYDRGSAAWQVCEEGATDCEFAQVEDSENQLVYLYGYKLLSAYPNDTYSARQSYDTERFNADGMRWCGVCHPSHVDAALGGTFHNHPTGCDACHGNPIDGSSADFPHTSTFPELLRNYPDALCTGCHTPGSIP